MIMRRSKLTKKERVDSMKKYGKMLMVGVLTLIAGVITANAKEMSVSELLKEVEKQNANTQDVYIIGEYAYTSKHIITSQDIMLASLSINAETKGKTNKDDSYEEMVMQHLSRTMDANGQYSQWSIVKPKIGKENKKLSDLNQKIDVDFIDYNYIKEESKATITFDVDSKDKYKETLKEYLKFETKDAYGESKLAYDGKKVSGLLLKNNKITLSKEDKDKYKNPVYFLAYVLEIPNASEKTKIKVDGINGEGTIEWKDFDVTEGNNSGVVVLVPINKDAWEKNKKIKLTINTDEEIYEDATYEIDLSELRFQGDSEVEIKLNNASTKDKETFDEWGYNAEANQNLQFEKGNLTGTLVEQILNSEYAFGKDKKDGYYFDFTFDIPDDIDISKVKISRVKDASTKEELKSFTQKNYDENNNLTILYRFDSTTTQCTNNCKLYYLVDFDGEGKEYLPTIYTIDYSKVIFEKTSLFTVEALPSSDADEFEDNTGWYDTTNGYNVKVEQDKDTNNKYKVTGVLPIFNDDSWEEKDPFDIKNKTLYYLGLQLKLTKADGITSSAENKINVKFFHGDEEDTQHLEVFADDFDSSKELYILKALSEAAMDGSTIADEDKVFTITLDLDGDENTYAPYSVTIDWSGLKLQDTSRGDFGNYELAKSKDELEEDEDAKKDLETYGFEFDADKDVNIKTENDPENGEIKQGLEGTIKEQQLESGFNELQGYYVPIKVHFPGKDIEGLEKYANTWTLILNTEDGKTKEYTPTAEEYKQGWVLVLFKIYKNGKPDNDKTIRYQIDYDGPDKFEYIPEEYTIKYDNLNFETEGKLTYKYRDNTGKMQTEILKEYEGEAIDLKDLSDLETDYRKFDGWYKNDNSKVENLTLGEHENITLTAHWKIDAETFFNGVVEDLNSKQTTYSDDFSDKFSLEKDEQNITINLNSPKVPLGKLADTSIPGTIAYILQKGEIKDITLSVEGEDAKFTSSYTSEYKKEYNDSADRDQDLLGENGLKLKQEIVKGAKDLFDDKLADKEDKATLDQLEYENKSFTIKLGEADETVSLVNADGTPLEEENKTYTFKFDSDFVVVDKEPQSNIGAKKIEDALKNEHNYNTVYVDSDINAEEPISVEKDVTITTTPSIEGISLMGTNDKTITVSDKDYVFNVKNGANVTISDLHLKGAKKAEIKVGETSAKNDIKPKTTVTANNLVLEKGADIEAGILVESTSSLEANNITFDGETSDIPAVRAINLSVFDDNKHVFVSQIGQVNMPNSTKLEYAIYNITQHDKQWCTDENGDKNNLESCTKKSYSDEYTSTSDTFYYVNPSNKKDYIRFVFSDYESGKLRGMDKVFEKGKPVKPTEYAEEDKTVTKNDKTYYFVGWGRVRTDAAYRNYADLITDWSNKTAENTEMYHAYYVEQDKQITINTSSYDKDGINEYNNKQYHTYKFADKKDGMTIAELKTIDKEFAEAWDALDKFVKSSEGMMQIRYYTTNDHDTQEATEDTKVSDNITLVIGTPVSFSPANISIDSNKSYTIGSNNKLSGIAKTQSEDGKYYIPVNISSQSFQDNSSITITNPNNEKTNYIYNSNDNNINLNLEILKQSDITTKNGKVYNIDVDYDGNKKSDASYQIDYSNLKTLEELINKAAENTQNAQNITIIKNNKIKNGKEYFTYKYDKDKNYTNTILTDTKAEQYTFSVKDIDSNHVGTASIVVSKKPTDYKCDSNCQPELNDWLFTSTIQKIKMGSVELSLLKDVISKNLRAIEKVNEINTNKYEVTLNKDSFVNWLNDTYITEQDNKITSGDETEEIKLIVELTDDNKYVKTIKTVSNFTIKSISSDNSIDVKFDNINKTKIASPNEFLGKDGMNVTNEQLKDFYEKGIKYWEKHTSSTVVK